jgi:hypothetical protein
MLSLRHSFCALRLALGVEIPFPVHTIFYFYVFPTNPIKVKRAYLCRFSCSLVGRIACLFSGTCQETDSEAGQLCRDGDERHHRGHAHRARGHLAALLAVRNAKHVKLCHVRLGDDAVLRRRVPE